MLFYSSLVKHSLTDAPLLREYIEGPTLLSSFLRPASFPPSFPSSFVRSASLSPSFLASLPPPCFVSSLLPFLPRVHPPSPLHPGGSGRVSKQAAGVSFSFNLSMRCPLVSYSVCQPQPRKILYESPEKQFSLDLCIRR